jgi:hypothetical protein
MIGLASWPLYTTPDFWTAWLTLGLLVVASVTAYFGVATLRTGAEALRLEADPFLVVTKSSQPHIEEREWYVITAPSRGLVATLRRGSPQNDEPILGPGATFSKRYGGRVDWSRVVLSVKNVGRSPAVAVRIDATFDLQVPTSVSYELPSATQQAGRDYPHQANVTRGSGCIELLAIMPQESVYVLIENRYTANVELHIERKGTTAPIGRFQLV